MGVRVRQRPDKPGWWLFIDHQGKQKKKRFADKETALKVARKIRERLALGDFSMTEEQPEAKPFSASFETWLNGYGPTRLKPSTQDLHWSSFNCHLKPFFGETDLAAITRDQVKRFLYEKVASGLSRDHVRNLLSALHAFLNHAVEDGHIPANPAARTSKLLYVRKEEKRSRIVFLTPEEETRLLDTCQEHFPGWYSFVLALLRLGVRIGESCALQWGDFDLEARSVEIRRNYVDGKMTTPKNGSGRRVDVSRQLAETLKGVLVERKKETLRQGWREVPLWVFINREET